MPFPRKEFDEILSDVPVFMKESGLLVKEKKPSQSVSKKVSKILNSIPSYVDKFEKGMNDFSDQMQSIGVEGEKMMDSMAFDPFDDDKRSRKK